MMIKLLWISWSINTYQLLYHHNFRDNQDNGLLQTYFVDIEKENIVIVP